MKPSEALTEVIKRTLRTRGLSYARLADQIGCSEASVKRIFARKNFDLRRLDQIIDALSLDLGDVLAEAARRPAELDALTAEQEREIVADSQLLLVAICAFHQLELEHITTIYRIAPANVVRCLLRLDRMGFLALFPNNVYRLRLSRTFRWRANGPIMQHFRSQAEDFLDHGFDGPGETLRMVNVRLSNEHRLGLLRRLEEVARDYADAHCADSSLPLAKRYPASLLIAVRSWEPPTFRNLRRMTDANLTAWLKSADSEQVPKRKTKPRPQERTALSACD